MNVNILAVKSNMYFPNMPLDFIFIDEIDMCMCSKLERLENRHLCIYKSTSFDRGLNSTAIYGLGLQRMLCNVIDPDLISL